MGGAVACMGEKTMHNGFWLENLKQGDRLEPCRVLKIDFKETGR